MCRVFVVWGGRVLVAFYEVLVEMDDEWNKLHVFMHILIHKRFESFSQFMIFMINMIYI